MRILHVATYVSQNAAFGGPITVALEQATELARRGHEVQFVAAWDGAAVVEVPGVEAKLFRVARPPVGRFRSLHSFQLMRHVVNHRKEFDIAHIHLARDLITLPVAMLLRSAHVPYMVQPHGMIMPDTRIRARIIDAVWTRRALRQASKTFSLTDRESQGLQTVSAGGARIGRIANGIGPAPLTPIERDYEDPEVIFLARLHPRKRVMAFAQMAEMLTNSGVRARFTVAGPDEGDLPELQRFLARVKPEVRINYVGALSRERAVARLAAATVYVLPSFGEVFPMSVLEALSVGTPVVLARDCGIADDLDSRGAAIVTDGSIETLASAVTRLLSSRSTWAQYSHKSLQTATEQYSVQAVVSRLEEAYANVSRVK